MSIRKSLAIAVSIFLMASGLDAAANPVAEVTKLLTAVRADNYDSSVAVAARAEFIKLDIPRLKYILNAHEYDALFHTPYGFSLIHGWMLGNFSPHDLPFYINSNFSFDEYFKGIVDAIQKKFRPTKYQVESSFGGTPSQVNIKLAELADRLNEFCKNLLSKWGAAKVSIEANKWAYYEHMQYMHAAIMQAGVVGKITSMPAIIKGSFLKPAATAGGSTPSAAAATPARSAVTNTGSRTWGAWGMSLISPSSGVAGGADSSTSAGGSGELVVRNLDAEFGRVHN
jgi:hypothetical protein